MAKKKTRKSRQMTVPMAIVAPLAFGIGQPIKWVAMDGMSLEEGLRHLLFRYTGYNDWAGKFDPFNPTGLAKGLFPLIVGALAHKFIGGAPLNVNRILAAHKVPFIRI